MSAAAEATPPTTEEQEDVVFAWVSCQEVEVLESVFQVLSITIPPESKGKKRSLRTKLLQYIEKEITEAESADEVSPVLLLLSDYIRKLQEAVTTVHEDEEEGAKLGTTTAEVKVEAERNVLDVASNVLETAMLKNVKLEQEIASMHAKIEKQKSSGKLDVLKLKELKFTGVIGGGEKDSLSFTSLN